MAMELHLLFFVMIGLLGVVFAALCIVNAVVDFMAYLRRLLGED